MGVLGALGGVPTAPAEPLAVTMPSPMTLLNYPLVATNVRILCMGSKQSRGQSSLGTMLVKLRLTYRQEGVIGLYRGAPLFLLHHCFRDTLRMGTDKAMTRLEGKRHEGGGEIEAKSDEGRRQFWKRMFAKYAIDALSYPILLASTRSVILNQDSIDSWRLMRTWTVEEGVLSLFNGLVASLLSTALDELMEHVLAACIDYCAAGNDVELTDKVMLKASGSSVVSILTAPINYIGIIQRCQSRLPGMPDPEPFPDLVKSLPWRSCATQFVLFGGIMAVNVKLIQWKVQLQEEQDREGGDGGGRGAGGRGGPPDEFADGLGLSE